MVCTFSTARRRAAHRGFTLVEMLVSVALVTLMMALFAEIYSLAAGAVSTQKGIGTNDQKVRTFVTVFRNDLEARTARTVMPNPQLGDATIRAKFVQEVDATGQRLGYLSISENNPNDQTDDVLSMTINVAQPRFGNPDALLFGRAQRRALVEQVSPTQYRVFVPFNQPEFDDGNFDNLPSTSTNPPTNTDPQYLADGAAYGPYNSQGSAQSDLTKIVGAGLGASRLGEVTYYLRGGNLYRSLTLIRAPYTDASATKGQPAANLITSNEPQFWGGFDYSAHLAPNDATVIFATEEMLKLEAPNAPLTPPVPRSLAVPNIRFANNMGDQYGSPIEFVPNTSGTTVFIGRLFRQELTQPTEPYPGDVSNISAGDPLKVGKMKLDPTTGLVSIDGSTPSLDTSRRGEELLIANVHEFDVQVFDDGLAVPGYVNLGNGGGGFYGSPLGPHTVPAGVGPGGGYGNRFDTWHPAMPNVPPYRGVLGAGGTASLPAFGPDGFPGFRGRDDDGDGVIDYTDTNGNGQFDSGEEDPEEVGWVGSDDERPLRSIQIRIRFYDPQSAQMRQLTLRQALVD